MSEVTEKNINVNIPFSAAELASLVNDILNVDKELKGSGVHREISVNETNLIINLKGTDLKRLRVALNALMKNILLIVKTVNGFQISYTNK